MNKIHKITFITALILLGIITTQSSFAQSATDSGEVEQSIKNRVQQAVNKKTNVVTAEVKGYVGIVDSVTSQSISILVASQGELFSVDESTEIIDENGTAIAIEEVPLGSTAIVTSQISTEVNLAAQQILVLDDAPTENTKESVLLEIVAYDEDEDSISALILPNLIEVTLDIVRGSAIFTEISLEDEIDFDDLKVKDKVLSIYDATEESNEIISMIVIDSESTQSAILDEL